MALPVGYAAVVEHALWGKPAGRPDSEGYFPIKLTFDGRKRSLLAIGSFSRSCIDPEEAARMEALHKRTPADGETLTGEEAEA
jgi:hypothetical protein